MLASWPTGIVSPDLPATVTTGGRSGCLKWRWLPRSRTCRQPSASRIEITSLTFLDTSFFSDRDGRAGPARGASLTPPPDVEPGLGHDGGVASRPSSRSVKISSDERTGWSSDRPRPDGAPAATPQPVGPLPRAVAGRPPALLPREPLDRGVRLHGRARQLPRAPDRGSRKPLVARQGARTAGRAGRRRGDRGARRGAVCGQP